MHKIKNKSIKWWISVGSCSLLFVLIGIFTYMKMDFIWRGVKITASVDKSEVSRLVKISGKAKNATYISLNGREIFIDKEGNFSENIALLPGLSVVTISAEDKFGHFDEKKLQVMYQESTGSVAIGNTIINTN